MPDFKFFCFICKKHIHIADTNEKDARTQFAACGHSDKKTAHLKRGKVGV